MDIVILMIAAIRIDWASHMVDLRQQMQEFEFVPFWECSENFSGTCLYLCETDWASPKSRLAIAGGGDRDFVTAAIWMDGRLLWLICCKLMEECAFLSRKCLYRQVLEMFWKISEKRFLRNVFVPAWMQIESILKKLISYSRWGISRWFCDSCVGDSYGWFVESWWRSAHFFGENVCTVEFWEFSEKFLRNDF